MSITDADLARVCRDGPAAITYYESFGLAEGRSRAVNMALSGAVSLAGLAFLGWSSFTMLVFMVVDAVITVLADIVRYVLAREQVAASHRRDNEASQVLLIVDGLEDGSATRADFGPAPNPGVILFFGIVSTLFLVPVIAAATEKIGIASLTAVLHERAFPWIVGLDGTWRILGALVESLRARRKKPGETMIFMDCGGVAVLYAALLILVWLPLKWGAPGLMAMFIVIYAFRVAFGAFAYWWTPRALACLARRLADNDLSVTLKA